MTAWILTRFELAHMARHSRTWGLRIVFVAALAALAAFAWPWDGAFSERVGSGAAALQFYLAAQLAFVHLIVPALVAPAVPAEREAGTLDLLVLASGDGRGVALGKALPQTLLALLVVVAGLPAGLMALPMGGASIERVAAATGHAAFAAVFVAAVSLRVSVSARSVIGSLAMSYVLLCVVACVCVVGGLIAEWICQTLSSPPHLWWRSQLLIFPTLCPWAAFVIEARGESLSWVQRIGAWGVLTAGTLLALRRTSRVLGGVDLTVDPKAREYEAYLRARSSGPRPVVRVASTTVGDADVDVRKSSLPCLPVWRDAMLWKEVGWRRIPALEVAVAVGGLAVLIMLSDSGAHVLGRADDPHGRHFGLFVDLVVLVFLVALPACVSVASERERGTLGLLLGCRFSPARILAAKLAAPFWSMRLLLVLLSVHLAVVVADIGPIGLAVIFVFVMTLASALGLTALASASAPRVRMAVPRTTLLLLLVWALPGVPASYIKEPIPALLEAQPAVLISKLRDMALLDHTANAYAYPQPESLLVFAGLSLVTAAGGFAIAARILERKTRA